MPEEPKENRSPYVIIRHRIPEGTIRHDDRIVRYWKSRETGDVVEVRRYLHVVPERKRRVVFWDPTVKHELSASLEDFKRDFEPVGNQSSQY